MTMPNNSNSRGVRRRRTSLLRNDYDQNIAPTIVIDAGMAQLDEPLMTLFCSYALSSNATIHKYGLNSLNNLLNILRDDNFSSNQRLVKKFHLAKKFLHDHVTMSIYALKTYGFSAIILENSSISCILTWS